jgi:hypothetical protein
MVDNKDGDREERTTIVTSDGDGRGSAAMILLVVAVAILLAVLFFGGVFDRDDDSDDLNVDINTTPDLNMAMPQTAPPPQVIVVPGAQTPPADVNVSVTAPPPEEPAAETNDINQVNAQ